MKLFRSKSRNRIYRNDLKRLDSRQRMKFRSQRQTRFLAIGLCVVAAVGVLGWGVWLGMKSGVRRMFSENPAYQITDIAVENAGEFMKPAQVLDIIRVRRGQNLLALDLTEMRRELELRSIVEKAELWRELPGKLMIRVTERVPLANISGGAKGAVYQIDRHGVIMDLSSFQKHSPELAKRLGALPDITGANIAELKIGRATTSPEVFQALELIQKLDHMDFGSSLEVTSIDVSRRGMLVVSTSDQATVKIGLSELDRQLQRLALIFNDARQRSERIVAADLTVKQDIPVKTALIQAPRS